jgi:hypothetical protein
LFPFFHDHALQSLLKEDDVSVASTRAETFRMSWHTARQNQHLFDFVKLTMRKSQLRSFRRAISLGGDALKARQIGTSQETGPAAMTISRMHSGYISSASTR